MLAAVREQDFQDALIARAKTQGWLVFHARRSSMDGRWATHLQGHPGFPDLVLARRGRLLFLELKTMRGRTTDGQRRWLAELAQVPGVEARVVCPSDWPVIDQLLAAA